MAEADLEAQVRQRYPAFVYLLDEPELRQLLLDAIDPNKGFSPEEFQARFEATNWYRTHGDSQRQWEALLNADPETARRQVQQRWAEIRDTAGELGVQFDAEGFQYLADLSIRYGFTQAEIRDRLIAAGTSETPPDPAGQGTGTTPGDLGAVYNEIRRLANSEYLVGIANEDAWRWARRIAGGELTLEGVKVALGDVARGRFSHLKDQIDQGIAPGTYFAPYKQLIAQELEVSAEAVNLLDPKWYDVLSKADGNQVRAMTMAEAQQHVRKQPEWERTSRARGMSAQLGNELLRTFGALA